MKPSRKYASFFEWPDKELKELGVVEELVASLAEHGCAFTDPRIQRPDPPDCVRLDAAGSEVALEVVELVSEEAVRRNEVGESVYQWWTADDIRSEIERLLSRKDRKKFNGGPYSDVAVVIFTDEPTLTAAEARKALERAAVGPFAQVTRAFLLFSYMPGRGYEAIALAVENGGARSA